MINNRTYQTLSGLAATLACVTGISVDALAVPTDRDEVVLSNLEQAQFVALDTFIPATAELEQKQQLTVPSTLKVADVTISDPVVPAQSNLQPTAPMVVSPSVQTRDSVLGVSHHAVDLTLPDSSASVDGKLPSLIAQTESTPEKSPTLQVTTRPQNAPYVSLSGAYQWRERSGESADTFTDFKGGYNFSGAIGYRFGDFRTDVEVSLFGNAIEAVSASVTGRRPGDGNVTGRAFMLNLYYDIPIRNSPLKPYLGGGIGIYNTKINNLTNDLLASVPAQFGGPFIVEDEKSNEVFAFQIRAGLGYEINSTWTVFLGYRYFGGSTLTFTDTIFGTLKPSGARLHAIEVGTRISF